jgi:cob(I)alamin adenosyltransferase
VECYGTIDELISQMGFARAICGDAEVREKIKQLQRELFQVGSAIATPDALSNSAPEIGVEMVDALTADVHRIEAMPGILNGWALPGELPDASALDVARTICRRAERLAVGLLAAGQLVNPHTLAYLNRLSDLLWLLSRELEVRAGADASLRAKGTAGAPWARAW